MLREGWAATLSRLTLQASALLSLPEFPRDIAHNSGRTVRGRLAHPEIPGLAATVRKICMSYARGAASTLPRGHRVRKIAPAPP